jgi:hypothetical protein
MNVEEWYEVLTDDDYAQNYFTHECGELQCESAGERTRFETAEKAEEAVVEYQESGIPKCEFLIVHVVEHRETVKTVPPLKEDA